MNKEIKKILEEKKALEKRIEKIDNFIDAYQDICPHKDAGNNDTFEYVGHDSHNDYYKCTICGLERNG